MTAKCHQKAPWPTGTLAFHQLAVSFIYESQLLIYDAMLFEQSQMLMLQA